MAAAQEVRSWHSGDHLGGSWLLLPLLFGYWMSEAEIQRSVNMLWASSEAAELVWSIRLMGGPGLRVLRSATLCGDGCVVIQPPLCGQG